MSNPLEVKVGDWVGIYNRMWDGNRPLARPCRVVSIGARIKVELFDRYGESTGRHSLLLPREVLAVFSDREEGNIRCTAAYGQWEARTAEIKKMETERDQSVLATLKGA